MSAARIRKQITMPWHSLALYGGLLGVLGAALFFRLGSLLPGYSKGELEAYQASLSLSNLLDNPLNAPFIVLERGLSYILSDPLLGGRVAATLIGLATLVLFAVIVRKWHDTRTAIIGTLLFGLSAWFLHTARMGAPEVLLFGVFALAVCGFWLKESKSWLALAVSLLLAGVLLYVPGMIWFVALGVVWQWRTVDRVFKEHLLTVTLAGLTMLAALAPLVWALYKDTSLIKPLLGLPQDWLSPMEMLRNVVEVPFHFFIRNEPNPAVWLGTAPIFDVFCLTMLVLGGYLYLRHRKLVRVPLFLAIFVLTAALMVVGGSVTYTVIIPFAYLIIAAGLSHLLNQWFTVFPRNPIAKTLGWGLIGVVLALVSGYHLTHYFVGWPHATATHEIYTVQSDTIDK
jgi:hypothetical protein